MPTPFNSAPHLAAFHSLSAQAFDGIRPQQHFFSLSPHLCCIFYVGRMSVCFNPDSIPEL